MNYVKEKICGDFKRFHRHRRRGMRRKDVPRRTRDIRGNKDITRGPGISIRSLFLSIALQ